MKALWQREPSLVLGILASILIAVLHVIMSRFHVTNEQIDSAAKVLVALIPTVTAGAIRSQVSPVKNSERNTKPD